MVSICRIIIIVWKLSFAKAGFLLQVPQESDQGGLRKVPQQAFQVSEDEMLGRG